MRSVKTFASILRLRSSQRKYKKSASVHPSTLRKGARLLRNRFLFGGIGCGQCEFAMALALNYVAAANGVFSSAPSEAGLQGHSGVHLRTHSSYNFLSRRSNGVAEKLSHEKLTWSGKFSSSGTHLLRTAVNHEPSGKIRGITSASLAGPDTLQAAANLFQLASAVVVPFYTVMILAPQWEWTKKLMESELTYFILGVGYFYLLCHSWTPETLGLIFCGKSGLPELPGITQLFTSTLTVASAWLHILAVDLFAGRHIFLDGVKHQVETRHSLFLCLMMCPIGIFSHTVTKSFVLFLRRTGNQDGDQSG